MKSVEELKQRLDDIKVELPSLRSDVALEQVDLNNQMDVIIEELSEYENEILEILKNRVTNEMPTEANSAIDELYKESENYRSIMKMLGKDEEFVERFGFDRTIYEIGHAVSVDRVNTVLKDFVNDLKSIGIEIEASNFNYSSFTVDYMELFFENMDSENFLLSMKKTFDEIYWECPLILTHLELCVRNLVTNNKKIIVRHINHLLNKSLINAKATKDTIVDKYVTTRVQYEELYYSDPFNMVDYFRKNRNEIEKYYSPSVQFDQLMGNITDVNYYYDLSNEDRTLFLNNVYDLYNDVREYEKIEKYKKLIDYVIGIYNNKDNLKGVYKTKLKDMAKLDKEKNVLDKKVNNLRRKRSKINSNDVVKINEINEQLKVVYNELAKKIEAIKALLDEANDVKFQETLGSILNPSTSIYEVIVFLSKYYAVLYSQIGSDKKIEKEMVPELVDDFRHIQYAAHLTVMKSTSFLDYPDVKTLIENKYKLYNIRVVVPQPGSSEFEALLINLKTVIRFNDLLRMALSPEDIAAMLRCEDILKEKAEAKEEKEN